MTLSKERFAEKSSCSCDDCRNDLLTDREELVKLLTEAYSLLQRLEETFYSGLGIEKVLIDDVESFIERMKEAAGDDRKTNGGEG